jgi:hypothetical protein
MNDVRKTSSVYSFQTCNRRCFKQLESEVRTHVKTWHYMPWRWVIFVKKATQKFGTCKTIGVEVFLIGGRCGTWESGTSKLAERKSGT